MGVYIHNMEMPRNCLACDWCVHTIPADNYICYRLNRAVIGVAKEDVNETVNACCPIVPVPSHGDLIDRDAFEKDISESVVFSGRDKTEIYGANKIINRLHHAPTVIEADWGDAQ